MTVASIISILSAVLAIVKFFVEYAQQQKWIDAGTAQATLKGLQDADDATQRAAKARELVRLNNARDPSGILRDDDGFRRPGD